MDKKYRYYAAIPLVDGGEPIHTGRNAHSEQECINDVFDFMTEGLDQEEGEMPFEEFNDVEKEMAVKSVYIIEGQDEPFDEEDGFDGDDDDDGPVGSQYVTVCDEAYYQRYL